MAVRLLLPALFGLLACSNNPYPASHAGRNIFYSSFSLAPKTLDPARSYSSDEYIFLQQIVEPPLQYHFLKRPYHLIPLTATELPSVEHLDREGKPLPADAPAEAVARAVYTIRIRAGIRYQNHPCFARDESGKPRYIPIRDSDLSGVYTLDDLPHQDTRELTAHDYVWQLKRLASPLTSCPILSTMENYILGFTELKARMQRELERIRAQRREQAGALYNQERDERENPIFLDLDAFECPGIRVLDARTYQIVLKKKYPQMIYWLAMPFFCPWPPEADRFFAQGPLVARNLTATHYPVGTGAYRIESFDANREIVLTRNENYRPDTYPSEGEPEDQEKGWLEDAGKPIPAIDRAVYRLEKEALSRWGKFLQGYFDTSGLGRDTFDQAVTISGGRPVLTPEMEKKGVRLVTSPDPTLYYFAFNMLDEEFGGYTPEKKKLRQAIAIAIDLEEYNRIFLNGRMQPAYGIVPPGIFGYEGGKEGINPFVYDWDEKEGKPVRKPIGEAKRLLAEAGYPDGRGKDGRPLVLYFDDTSTGAEAKSFLDWLRKQLRKINVDLQPRQTDWHKFRDKVRRGAVQFFGSGWHADYPDPENFFFLLYGPNSARTVGGENSANYDNPEFNRLFLQMESMANGPERLAILRKMTRIVQEDVPWIPRFFVVNFQLHHSWYFNAKIMPVGGGTLKYRRIDGRLREEVRAPWNEPILWPVLVLALAVSLAVVPAFVAVHRRGRRAAV